MRRALGTILLEIRKTTKAGSREDCGENAEQKGYRGRRPLPSHKHLGMSLTEQKHTALARSLVDSNLVPSRSMNWGSEWSLSGVI